MSGAYGLIYFGNWIRAPYRQRDEARSWAERLNDQLEDVYAPRLQVVYREEEEPFAETRLVRRNGGEWRIQWYRVSLENLSELRTIDEVHVEAADIDGTTEKGTPYVRQHLGALRVIGLHSYDPFPLNPRQTVMVDVVGKRSEADAPILLGNEASTELMPGSYVLTLYVSARDVPRSAIVGPRRFRFWVRDDRQLAVEPVDELR